MPFRNPWIRSLGGSDVSAREAVLAELRTVVQTHWSRRYTELTGKDANFLGIRFMHLRPLCRNPF